MAVTVRPLTDADLPAVLAHLRPTEERSTFLVGNALEAGITDRGGPRNGPWVGAFDGERLVGVVAYARGPASLLVACGGCAAALLTDVARLGVRPRLLLGTADRVDEALAALPARWRVERRKHETLMVLRWPERVPAPPLRRPASIETPTAAHVADVARLLDTLTAASEIPRTPAENLARAERIAREGTATVAVVGGRAVALSSRAAATGHFVHVGATATDPAGRRAGFAGACVDAILHRARADGCARDGAVLFTGETNLAAQALYARLGFRPLARFDLCVMAAPA